MRVLLSHFLVTILLYRLYKIFLRTFLFFIAFWFRDSARTALVLSSPPVTDTCVFRMVFLSMDSARTALVLSSPPALRQVSSYLEIFNYVSPVRVFNGLGLHNRKYNIQYCIIIIFLGEQSLTKLQVSLNLHNGLSKKTAKNICFCFAWKINFLKASVNHWGVSVQRRVNLCDIPARAESNLHLQNRDNTSTV